MPANPARLRELQQTIMTIMWSRQSATTQEIIAELSDPAPGYTTIVSVLQSLEKQKLISHSTAAGSRSYVYRATLSSYDARGEMLQDVMHRLFAGSPALLVRHLLETEGFSLQELRAIRDVLERQERAITGSSISA